MALSTCCGCISLKKGSLIIGIFSLIGCLGALIITCIFPAMINLFVEQNINNKNGEIIVAVVKGCSAGIITYVICLTILTIIFIIGVVKMNHKLILPYLCVGFTNFLTIVPTGIALMTLACTVPVESGRVWGCFVQYLFASMINVYFMMVIYYHYREVKSGIHRGVIYPPNAP